MFNEKDVELIEKALSYFDDDWKIACLNILSDTPVKEDLGLLKTYIISDYENGTNRARKYITDTLAFARKNAQKGN